MSVSILKAIGDLNVDMVTIVDFFANRPYLGMIEEKPNYKFTEEQYIALYSEFNSSLLEKKEIIDDVEFIILTNSTSSIISFFSSKLLLNSL